MNLILLVDLDMPDLPEFICLTSLYFTLRNFTLLQISSSFQGATFDRKD